MSDLVKAETTEEAIKQIRRIIVTAERDIKSCEGGITKQLVKSSAYDDIKAVLGIGGKGMKEFYFVTIISALIIVDIIQGAMITSLHGELDFVSRIVSTYLRQKTESISKTNVKSGDFESKERR